MRFLRRFGTNDGSVTVMPLANHGVLFRLGDEIDARLSQRIVALADDLAQRRMPGVVEVIPSYTTLLLILDPVTADVDGLDVAVRSVWGQISRRPANDSAVSPVIIPVVYGGTAGPDLMEVARSTGLSADEVVARHQGGMYQVGAIGFAPGFAFLIGLPRELATPRRSSPRTSVPTGSVGIGGAQTGIYSLPTPGGWSLIGRTTTRMFDPEREPPSLLRAGDRVRFEPVAGPWPPAKPVVSALPVIRRPSPREAIEVLAPGLQTTVQDLGREGYGHVGVAPGGAADRTALVTGNRLVGNPDDAAGLEMTLHGPRLQFLRPGRMVLTGADLGYTLNGLRLPVGAVRVVGPGDELDCSSGLPRYGARGYLCLRGGIDVPVRLGSRSTDLNAGFGGLDGRVLRGGDRLRAGYQRAGERRLPGPLASIRSEIRVVAGPQRERFADATWQTFLDSVFTVSPSSNRMGLRLDGSRLMPESGREMISEGMVTGAIQVTGDGQPIVMLPARATIGGYPKIAVVVADDLDALGQLKPGDVVRFREVAAG